MKEQQNIALIQKIFEAFGRGDIQAMLDTFSADAEVFYPGPAIIPQAGRRKGKAERISEPCSGGVANSSSAIVATQIQTATSRRSNSRW